MSDALPLSYLARHGETAWSISRQNTGRTDLPLTAHGDAQARRLFWSGHVLRVFAARWLGLEPGAGRLFVLGTASLSVMGFEHNQSEP